MPGLPLFMQTNTLVQRQEAASLPPLALPPLTRPQPFGAKKAGAGLLGNAPQLALDPQIQLYLIEKLFADRLTPFDLRAALRGRFAQSVNGETRSASAWTRSATAASADWACNRTGFAATRHATQPARS